MERPKRKPSRLRNYDYAQTGAYFITVCTVGRKKLLGGVVGGDAHVAPRVELSAFGKVTERYLCSIAGIDRYVIMPNHIHMVILIAPDASRATASATQTQSIPQLISSFKVLVTKELHQPIFQRTFYDHII